MTLSPAGAVEVHLAGRDREWQRIDDFVAAVPTGARSLVIRGEAGIGKTVLWRAALDRHRAAGHRVLVTRPAEEEMHGLTVGLIDLFEHVEPEPGTLDPEADVFDRGRAVLRTLRRLAVESPVVLAVDDVQWLDPVSSRALRYAVRRLEAEPVAFVMTQRSGSASGNETPLEVAEFIDLGPLSLDAVRQVLATVVESIPRPMLERIHELSAGNPMYAIELARGATPGDPLGASAPPSLRAALSSRLDGVSPGVRELLAVSAAMGPTDAAAVVRATDRPDAAEGLAAAVDRGLLVVDAPLVVRFAHPLLASVVLDGINVLDRRALHARLAVTVDCPDARARHLALSSDEPDARVAEELEAAADRASRRGAPALAAEFMAHARRVTPPDDDDACARRDLAEIAHRAAAGETARALALADALLARLGPGRLRLEAVTQRVFLDTTRSEESLGWADAEIGDDELLHARVLDLQSWIAGMARGDLEQGMRLSEQALSIARRHDDDELAMLAAGTLATTALFAGRPRPEILDEAMAIAARRDGPRLGRWPQVFRGRHCLWNGNLPEARRRFQEMRVAFVRSGSEFQRPYRLYDCALAEIAAGNLAAAADLVDDALEAATDAGNIQALAWLAYPSGLVHAHLGNRELSAQAAGDLAEWGSEHDEPPRASMAHHVRGLIALAAGEPQAALAELGAGVALATRLGYRHPGVIHLLPDAIEAAALAGADDRGAAWTAELAQQGSVLDAPWVDAAARRAHALHAGGPAGLDELAAAAATFDDLGYRLDAARTMLDHGRALRRAGRRTAAADRLALARDRFVVMGASPWAARAVAELERVAPGRSGGQLTPTEERIAALVVAGRRNREIAAELFISVATVEAHLTRMYRKVGVRSRTELAKVVDPPREE